MKKSKIQIELEKRGWKIYKSSVGGKFKWMALSEHFESKQPTLPALKKSLKNVIPY